MQPAPVRLVADNEKRSTQQEPRGGGAGPAHTVQFYENEHFLAAAVADFLAAGISVGQPLVVIATEPHREAFLLRLKAKGLDVEYAARNGYLTMLDAHETLAHFMIGTVPDPQRFKATVGSVLESSLRGNTNGCVRAYGEMVDILWKDGNTEGAIRVEELWNELATTHSFSLLCAYSMGNFYKEAQTADFRRICNTHAHVVPTESYTNGDEAARLLEITLLQQRAQALENEIEHRVNLEARLRDALADRARLLESEQTARAEAEAATRAKSQFLAVMSHELRTPLNAIGGHVQLVEMGVHGPVTAAQREALRRVERSQRHLLSLINDVLNLIRVETGRVAYEMTEFSIDSVVADVTSMVDPLFEANKLTYSPSRLFAAGSDAKMTVRGDREKVQQILLNLITNAIKFTPRGGRIWIDTAPCPESSGMVCVAVGDTGIGIPPEKLDSIFEPFVQLASRPISGEEGVGLGLAISRDLARGMGGDLSATSTPGEGTTFLLKLPRA